MPRTRLPDRRACWTQKVRIGHHRQPFYANFGEYADGRVGEVWIDVNGEGTFLQGILGSLGIIVSLALQCGTPVADVAKALREIDFPPDGEVRGSPAVAKCTSVTDWIAAELLAYYGEPDAEHVSG